MKPAASVNPCASRVEHFRPDRSQKRAHKANQGSSNCTLVRPSVTKAKLALYDRYHEYQAERKGWPEHPAKDAAGYADSFVRHPFAVEEWCYTLKGGLIGVGYVDVLADAPRTAPGRRAACRQFTSITIRKSAKGRSELTTSCA